MVFTIRSERDKFRSILQRNYKSRVSLTLPNVMQSNHSSVQNKMVFHQWSAISRQHLPPLLLGGKVNYYIAHDQPGDISLVILVCLVGTTRNNLVVSWYHCVIIYLSPVNQMQVKVDLKLKLRKHHFDSSTFVGGRWPRIKYLRTGWLGEGLRDRKTTSKVRFLFFFSRLRY